MQCSVVNTIRYVFKLLQKNVNQTIAISTLGSTDFVVLVAGVLDLDTVVLGLVSTAFRAAGTGFCLVSSALVWDVTIFGSVSSTFCSVSIDIGSVLLFFGSVSALLGSVTGSI